MQPKSMAEVATQMAERRAAYNAQFELVQTPLGFRAQHKVSGLSYQAHDISLSREQTLKDSHHDSRASS